jgi:predicted short-subunit dehydrogenase-like oxidoreductase (DUF2520 family)
MSVTINLIGSGRVGQTICHLASRSGRYQVQDIYNRNIVKAGEAAAFIGTGRVVGKIGDMQPADLWIVTVPDSAIADAATQLAGLGLAPSVALHCSGFLRADDMVALAQEGWMLASAHPVFSFADPSVSVEHFAGTLVGTEGDTVAVARARELFEAAGARTFQIVSSSKVLYHGAAVIANNLTTVLQALAREAWAEAGVSEGTICELHEGLLRSTLENVIRLGPKAALTGPAARGDTRVVTEQKLAIAQWHPAAGDVYALLSEMAANLKTGGGTRPGQER